MVWFGLDAEEYDRKYSDRDLIQKMFPYFSKFRNKMILIIALLTLTSVLSSIIPIFISFSLNYIESSQNTAILILVVFAIFIFNFASWILNWFQYRLSSTIVANITLDLQKDVSSSIFKQNLSFFDKIPTGKIVSRANSDTKNFQEIATLFMQSASSLLVVIFVFIPMFIINIPLATVLLLMIPFVFIATLSFRKSARKKTLLGQRSTALVNKFMQEAMTGIQIAKTFRREQYLYDDFKRINNQSYKVNLGRGLLLNIMFPILMFIQGITISVLIYFGGQNIISTSLSLGDFYLFIQNLSLLFFPLFSVAAFWPQFQSGLASIERVFSLIEAPLTVNQTDEIPIQIDKGRITIEALTFSYDGETNVFDNFSLDIKPGESVAIVGHTGAGKSTLAKLIGRFYEFQAGNIFIDNIDIRNVNLGRYRRQIAFIPQTPFIWGDTLLNNLLFGNPNASQSEIINALDMAGGSDWVFDLPDGLNTHLSERGKILSMGQKQLVAFARVLLEDPKILVLDEATASIDPFTETRIQDALEKSMKNRTTIIIAHRLWTVRNVDRIIVVDHGKIIEQGNHKQLIKKQGYYAELYELYFRHQSFEYIEKFKDEILQKAYEEKEKEEEIS